ncbi:MAG: hypothetical protein J3K34DRAFT_283926 [Monoraphidium minutum]|nr:MAG: hypothetical protein J3K34DRAFT_283926 [Monoraphidium minutum]
MAFVYTWLRLSNAKLLDWARAFSYQPKDIAWAQQQVSEFVASKARAGRDPRARGYARMALGGLSRGGTHGDEIRHGILNIMRDHGIREGNRPGLDEPWLEQWHQKLHQNTTPEDVVIADAYIAFLQSGSHDDYWRVLGEAGLTQERLESWDQPLTSLPLHLPHLLPSIQHYRWVLMTCHSGAELDVALEMARGHLSDDLRWHMYDLTANRHAWWAPGKCLELRRRLAPMVATPDAARDVQLLDIALESWLRLLIERTDRKSLSADDLVELLSLVLANAALTGHHGEMAQVAAQWERVRDAPERWSPDWCLAAAAGLGRVQLTLGQFADELCREVQPYAEMFGARCGIAPAHTLNFGEEVVRDQPVFVAALLAAELEPRLRTAAGCSPWQVVSQPGLSLSGRVLPLPGLAEVQGAAFSTPTVVLAQALGGMEDIPEGVVGLLTRSSTDVLSHVAIRARSQGVLLATCLGGAPPRRAAPCVVCVGRL